MRYQLKIERQVLRDLQRLPGHIRQRILQLIDQLLSNPRPQQAKQLRGNHADKWQISLDAWRIVYCIDEGVLIVEVLRIGKKHGPEFYEGLETIDS